MKKLIISIISILLIYLLVVVGMKGISIGSLVIPSISQLQAENDNLKSDAQDATVLASTRFTNKKLDVDAEVKKLEKAKSEYSDLTQVSTDNQLAAASQIRVYDIGKLWTKYGNYAKREGIVIDIVAKNLQEVSVNGIDSSTQDKKTYLGNLSFTASGSYVGIEEFVTEIEDDTELGFRIENFKMVSSSSGSSNNSSDNNSGEVKATFDSTGIIITGITTASATQNDHGNSDGTADGTNGATNSSTNNTTTNDASSSEENTSSSASANTTSSSSESSSNTSYDETNSENVVR